MAGLIARRIAYYVWNGSGLEPEETIDGLDQSDYADTMQRIIDDKGPKWVADAVKE